MKESVRDLSVADKDNIDFKTEVVGIDFEKDITLDEIISYYGTTGFQATHLTKAIKILKTMRNNGVKVYFGCTSNIISSGMREIVKYMAKNKYFEVFVCTGGGIEEDIIKCLSPTYIGEFDLDGKSLRENGWNRIGNLVIRDKNYFLFEEWFNNLMTELLSGNDEVYSREGGYSENYPLILTPSKFIEVLGRKINDERSVLYWCYKNKIKVYSPGMTDGSIGDMLTFLKGRNKFKLDIVEDIYNINSECFDPREKGALIIGCGLVKHHILNANLFNNGLDYCVLLNTANEFDGSDAGASLNESFSWGKVKSNHNNCVKVYGDASIIFPLMVYGAYKSNSI